MPKRGRRPRTPRENNIADTMRKFKHKTLRSGTGRKGEHRPYPVAKREQAIAIALSVAEGKYGPYVCKTPGCRGNKGKHKRAHPKAGAGKANHSITPPNLDLTTVMFGELPNCPYCGFIMVLDEDYDFDAAEDNREPQEDYATYSKQTTSANERTATSVQSSLQVVFAQAYRQQLQNQVQPGHVVFSEDSTNGNMADNSGSDGYTPPQEVASVAKRALDMRAGLPPSRRGGTAVGVARANQLAGRRKLSPETIKRMKSYFERHAVDKEAEGFSPGEQGYPSKGKIAWDLWGGDAARTWVNKIARTINK